MNKVIGNTVGLPNPRTDWSQSDKTKADYLKNKEELKKELDGKAEALIFESEKATPLVLTDTKEAPLVDYKIYGNANGVGGEYDDSTGMFMIPVTVYGKNLIKLKTNKQNFTGTVKLNEDGSITIDGTETNGAVNNICSTATEYFYKAQANQTVTLSCKGTNSNCYLAVRYDKASGGSEYFSITSSSKTVAIEAGDSIRYYIQLKANATVSTTVYPQLEFGNRATNYVQFVEPVTTYIPMPHYMSEGDYVDFKNKKVVSEGVTYENVDLPEIVTNYPSTSLVCDGEMQVTYKADTTNAYKNLKSELDTLKQAIISVGGNL